jgi:hypothetical protein
MNICILGNSHVGALKRAYDKISTDYPDIQITFFAQRGYDLTELDVDNGKLVANSDVLRQAIMFTSGGIDSIAPESYDIFLIYALGTKPNFVAPGIYYSSQVKELALADIANNSAAMNLIKKIRCLTDKPIYLGHDPLPAGQSNDVPADDHGMYIDGIKKINDHIYQKLNVKLLMQPLETLVSWNRTNINFSSGSERLAVGDVSDAQIHPEDDEIHMNDQFGEMWLIAFLRVVQHPG